MLAFLSGKKTYLIALTGLAVIGAWMMGWVDGDVAEKALAALGFGGAITLRAGLAKVS